MAHSKEEYQSGKNVPKETQILDLNKQKALN